VGKQSGWVRTVELFVFVTLLALGATTIATASWARDMAQPRVTLLGADRGVSLLVTAGPARVLIVEGTDPAQLGNAVSKARHIGLDRLDLLIVSGNGAATELATRTVELLRPRMVIAVGSGASLAPAGIVPGTIVEGPTEFELPEGVSITIDVWPAAGGENDDVTWTAHIERGGASVFWASDREALAQASLPEQADVTVLGRGKPAADTLFPNTRAIVVAGEPISGPELRELVIDAIGPDVETLRVFAGEEKRVELDPAGIRSVPDAVLAGAPITA
jgi:hypothetical protein